MTFQKTDISFASTGRFSKLFMDYVSGNKGLRSFYGGSPGINSFEKAIAERSGSILYRDVLVSALQEQYKNVPGADLQQEQIRKLGEKNTYTVCTGHQLCLFTGPLYFVYKIISTINLAEALKKAYPSCHFIPVYWMATEDHDIEEIRSIHLFGRSLSWDDPSATGAAGRLNTASIAPLIDELKEIFGNAPQAKELIGIFSGAYLSHKDLASATRSLVHSLFGEYGLLVLDGDDAALKGLFADIMRDDITDHINHKLVSQSAEELKKLGYAVQVNPREINVFLLKENERLRIERSDDAVLDLPPERYSPNVVLRPLYQQKILPNLAYVGGPGEIAYWLEYKRMFDYHGIQFPILIPRNFALLTDEKTSAQMSRLGLSMEDLFSDTEELIKRLVTENAGSDLSLEKQSEKIRTVFSEIKAKSNGVDPTLNAAVEAEMQKVLNTMKAMETKLMRAEKQKQEVRVNQIRKLKEKFLPAGVLQERHENFSPYYIKTGKQFIRDLKESFDPFEFKLLILEQS